MPYMEQDPHKAAKDLTYEVVENLHVKDNITVLIVPLNRGVKH
jgi:hypothetical protein